MIGEEMLSMVTYVRGNLFESPTKVLVNTVNTVGVMGKGIAREFKRVYPDMFREYQRLCEHRQLDTGMLWLYKTPHKWILNFPTKKQWRQPSRLEYIELGLEKFTRTYAEKGITSIAFPALGCGNGELDWETQVRPLMESYLNRLPISIFIYLYSPGAFTPEHRVAGETAKWLRSEPAALPFTEVMEDIRILLRGDFHCRTIPGERWFRCWLESDSQGDPGILIDDGKSHYLIENTEIRDLWQIMRDYGFCADYTIPGGLQDLAPYLLGVFSRLSYVGRVSLSRRIGGVVRESAGLQIKAPSMTALEANERTVTPEPVLSR